MAESGCRQGLAVFSVHHIAISVSDLENSVPFYSRFGFEEVLRWQAGDGSLTIVQMRLGGLLLEIFCCARADAAEVGERSLEADLKRPGTKHFGLGVADIEACRRQLIGAGLLDESTVVTRGRTGVDYLFIRDPDGIFIEIVQDDRGLI